MLDFPSSFILFLPLTGPRFFDTELFLTGEPDGLGVTLLPNATALVSPATSLGLDTMLRLCRLVAVATRLIGGAMESLNNFRGRSKIYKRVGCGPERSMNPTPNYGGGGGSVGLLTEKLKAET